MEVALSRQSLDEVLRHHIELLKQLEKLRVIRDKEKRAFEAEKKALEAKLTDTRAQADGEIGSLRFEVDRLKGEAEKTWTSGRRGFQNPQSSMLCLDKASVFFECGFKGCLAQFRANGYFEKEHPTSFLNVIQTLEDMPEEGEATDEDASGDDASTSHKDPPSPSFTYIFAHL
ncbi:hypothetical protein F511_43304 [Dorcoceras hygrometricum]|uniref:Uncharacterized protein n=1 Tax=Dorcoceras hygrometricum TaxID=472368 RepID=A0A2Z7AQ88_9LAMI|nr:hypothetical protein F511_43304 [Dorcoceras hygrometricum]